LKTKKSVTVYWESDAKNNEHKKIPSAFLAKGSKKEPYT
jgi:hypothetical protein